MHKSVIQLPKRKLATSCEQDVPQPEAFCPAKLQTAVQSHQLQRE